MAQDITDFIHSREVAKANYKESRTSLMKSLGLTGNATKWPMGKLKDELAFRLDEMGYDEHLSPSRFEVGDDELSIPDLKKVRSLRRDNRIYPVCFKKLKEECRLPNTEMPYEFLIEMREVLRATSEYI